MALSNSARYLLNGYGAGTRQKYLGIGHPPAEDMPGGRCASRGPKARLRAACTNTEARPHMRLSGKQENLTGAQEKVPAIRGGLSAPGEPRRPLPAQTGPPHRAFCPAAPFPKSPVRPGKGRLAGATRPAADVIAHKGSRREPAGLRPAQGAALHFFAATVRVRSFADKSREKPCRVPRRSAPSVRRAALRPAGTAQRPPVFPPECRSPTRRKDAATPSGARAKPP